MGPVINLQLSRECVTPCTKENIRTYVCNIYVSACACACVCVCVSLQPKLEQIQDGGPEASFNSMFRMFNYC